MRARLAALRRRLQIGVLRALPLPPRAKQWLVWLLLPRFTVGVAALIRDENGRVLALRSAWHGEWQLPGGAVNYGESFDDALRREVREETGLSLASLERVTLVRDRTGRMLHVVYRARIAPGAVRLSEEHSAWAYRAPEDLPPAARWFVRLAS
jgi:ADP-ribose pyrophosphatase YjhB (NUDIX family)